MLVLITAGKFSLCPSIYRPRHDVPEFSVWGKTDQQFGNWGKTDQLSFLVRSTCLNPE